MNNLSKVENSQEKNKLSLVELISLAVGTMIGASIFTLLATGAKIAGYYLPLALFLSGLLALTVAYSYANLGKKIISDAGPIAFILKAFGDNLIVGVISLLMWFTYVVSLALFAKGFAIYFCPLFGIENKTIVEVSVLLFFMVLNFFGSKVIGSLEKYMVFIKVGILAFFVLIGAFTLKHVTFSNFNPTNVFVATMLFFLSYIGFGLVTNASEHAQNPEKNIPRAIYWSIFIVMLIYISVAFVVVQHVNNFNNVSENILAQITSSIIGKFGYILVSIGAIISTLSAINATLYGGTNIAYSLAKKGELPEFFERKTWFNEPEGLYITTFLAIIFTLFFNLESVASIISLVFFIIYILVLIAHIKLIEKREVEGNKKLVIFNLLVLSFVFISFLIYNFKENPKVFITFTIVVIIAFLIELFIKSKNLRNFENYLKKLEQKIKEKEKQN
jgi:amino acid transporter